MGGLVVVLLVFIILIAAFLGVGYFVWRGVLRFAKGIERGIKMVPILIDLPPPSEDIEGGGRDTRDIIQENISQAEVLYNLIAGTAKKGFKSKFYGQRHVSLEIVAINGVIRYYTAVPVILTEVIKQAVLTAYPGAYLEEVEDHNIFSPTGKISGTIGGEIILKEPYSYPIATFNDVKRDAIQALINAMSSLQAGDGAAVQLLIRPAFSGWTKASEHLVSKKKKSKGKGSPINVGSILQAPFKVPEKKEDKDPQDKQLSNLEQSVLDAVEEKTKHPGYEVLIRVVASSNTAARSQAVLQNLVTAFSLFDAPGLNGFKFNEAKDIENFVTAFIFRFFPPEAKSNILNSIELATLFHFPESQFTHTSQLQRQYSKQVEGPSRIPDQGLLLGYNMFRGVKKEIRMSPTDRARHVYIVGQTGTGKTTLLENLVVQDMNAGAGLAFIDPHGDAAEKFLSMIPKHRTEDVIYFNPGDMNFPLGLNLFEFDTPEQKDFLIQEAINMLYKLYDPQHQGIIGPRYEHWFRNAALTLMSDPKGATFIEIPKVFTDRQYQREKMQHVKDPTVLDFWNKEMAQTSDYHKSEILGWFVSKFGAFMSNEMMRNIMGQTKSAFNLRQVMDEGKILIVNLSKGRVGELNAMLLGMIFVMKFQAAAMSRANTPENERRPFSLYVDEFQNFSTDSFGSILSEARKYGLSMTVANQFITQLTEEIRDAVFGNVGTIITYRTGPNDADFMVKQFSPAFDTRDLVNLPNYQTIVRLMVGGLPSQPFTMKILPPLQVTNPQLGVALKQLSAAKYGRPRPKVEAEIFKRLETKPAPSPFGALGQNSGRMAQPGRLPSARGGQLPQRTPGQTGKSFLDEWLAKRKAQNSGVAAQPITNMPRPQSHGAAVEPSTQAAAQPATISPAPSSQEIKPAEPTKTKAAKPVMQKPAPPETKTAPKSPNPVSPAKPSPQVIKRHEKPIASPVQPGSTLVPDDKPKTAKVHEVSSGTSTTNKSAQPTYTEQESLAEKISSLESKAQEQTTKSKSQEIKSKSPLADESKKANVPKLEPGEIYIDEDGIIHQAEEIASS